MKTLRTAIVRSPGKNFANGVTTALLGPAAYERALAQHEEYCTALLGCGLTVIRLDPDEQYPDSTFIEDTAVLTEHGSILARPGEPSRLGEAARMADVLAGFLTPIGSIQPPGTLDGGDVCQAGNHFFIGLSARTNELGAQQLADFLQPYGYTSTCVDIRHFSGILHLKSGIAYLGNRRLVVVPALAERKEFCKYELVQVECGETYAANCLAIGEHVLVASGYPLLKRKIANVGYQTIPLEMGEFQKMDGGLSCLSLRF